MSIMDILVWAFSAVTLVNSAMSFWICSTLKEMLEMTLKAAAATTESAKEQP